MTQRVLSSPKAPSPDDDLRAMAAAAWHKRGWACLPVAEINNEWDRAFIETVTARFYGPRSKG